MTPPISGILTGLGLMLAFTIDEKADMPIAAAASLCIGTATIVWWIGRKVQKWDDRLASIDNRLAEGDQTFCELSKKIDALSTTMIECRLRNGCEDKKGHHK